LMWPILGQAIGTLYFDNAPNVLDQFLVNKNMLKENSTIKILPDSAEAIRFPEMVETGKYPRPIPFGGMGKTIHPDGFSDHFPVSATVVEAD